MHTHNKHRTIYRSEVTGKAEVYESTDSEKRQTGKWADLKKYADNYTIEWGRGRTILPILTFNVPMDYHIFM